VLIELSTDIEPILKIIFKRSYDTNDLRKGYVMLFASACFIIWLVTKCSMILQHMHVIENGR
jgi:hypothetical protein